MKIEQNISLAQYTTFKIGGLAKFFCIVKNEDDLVTAVKYAKNKKIAFFILGGGSNVLISDNGFAGLIIKMENKGISYIGDRVTAAAGEVWDELVNDAVEHNLSGLENLSSIPGTVGATPVQNIGAYGVDASEVIESVRALDTDSLDFVDLTNAECGFGYRDSIFKHQKNRFIIVSVVFKLKSVGKVNICYKDLSEYFFQKGIGNEPTIKEVREAVIEVRRNKLPDWNSWGTAGSFFKNPIIPVQQFIDLRSKYPDLQSYPEHGGMVKVSLGWILDKVCHVKGLTVGHVHVYEKQALVVVATAGATAKEVVELAKKIQNLVKEKTGIVIEAEVEWVN